MRISICSKSRARLFGRSSAFIWAQLGGVPIEYWAGKAQIFPMITSRPSRAEPEILSPAALSRLGDLEARHETEAAQLARLEALANLMDARFRLPIFPVPIGLDTIVGLIPGIGDTISLGVAGVIVAGAKRLNMPKRHLVQMGGNILIDWVIGLVPIIGDLFDIGWQGNIRNVRIARAHLEARWEQERDLAASDMP